MFRAERDYRRLAVMALACLSPGGSVLACTNHRGIVARDFKGLLTAGAREAAIEVREMKVLPDPVDFPPPPGKPCHLKSVLLRAAT
jgi:23S rRNA (cytosine1962-C5)-methyltransferase